MLVCLLVHYGFITANFVYRTHSSAEFGLLLHLTRDVSNETEINNSLECTNLSES